LNIKQVKLDYFVLGLPYFRKVSVVFDYENLMIGLSKSFENNGSYIENFLS